MTPYLAVCQLGIGLLVLITIVSGFSVLPRRFIVGMGIIMAGSTLAGKTHCRQFPSFYERPSNVEWVVELAGGL
jgi:hypothetical protein